MTREFPVVPPDLRIAFAIVAGSGLLALFGIGLGLSREPEIGFLLLLVMVATVATILLSLRRRKVVLDGSVLRVTAGLHSAKARVADLDLDRATIADLNRDRGLRPFWQTFGTRVPGYYAGHFRLRDRRRVFALLSARDRVLVLPRRDGRLCLLLSLERPQALLDALNRAAAAASRSVR